MSHERKRGPKHAEVAADGFAEYLEWFARSRPTVSGRERNPIYQGSRRLLEYKREKFHPVPRLKPVSTGPNWTPLGPSVTAGGLAAGSPAVSGRVNAIAVGPGGNRVYAGAANGGLWVSENGGKDWTTFDDGLFANPALNNLEADSLSVGALAVSFATGAGGTDQIFVGSGEFFFDAPGDNYFGVGIRSALAGAAGMWSLEATNLAGIGISRLAIDPGASGVDVVYAASGAGLFSRPPVGSASFGTWTQVQGGALPASPGPSCCDVAFAIGSAYYAAFFNDSVYRRDVVTGSWTALSGLAAAPGRIALAVCETDSTAVYAFAQDDGSGAPGLYRLNGTAFVQVGNIPANALGGSLGVQPLAVDPTDASIVYLGGTSVALTSGFGLALFRGQVTGSASTFSYSFNPANASNPAADPTYIGAGIHGDGHVIAFGLDAGNTGHVGTNVWVGCDGGVFNSTTSGAAGSFSPRNTGLSIGEMTYLAQRPDTDAIVFAGSMNNGTARLRAEEAGFEAPQSAPPFGGAGGIGSGGVAVNPNDNYRVMAQTQRAGRYTGAGVFQPGLWAATDGGAGLTSWQGLNLVPTATPSATQRAALNTESNHANVCGPISAVDAAGTTRVAFGTYRPWVSTDWGATWVTIPTASNPYTAATPNATQDAIDTTNLTPIQTVAWASATRLNAVTSGSATASSKIIRYDLVGATWATTDLTLFTGLPATPFSVGAIAEDPAGNVYVTLGAHEGTSQPVIYVHDEGTATWRSIGVTVGASTFDVPAHAIVIDPDDANTIYVGTDLGVFRGVRSAGNFTWTQFSDGLPEAAVVDLAVHRQARLLRAATHGRGVWEIEIPTATGVFSDGGATELYLRSNYADTGRIHGGARSPWIENAPDPTATSGAERVWHWMSADIKVQRPSLSGPTLPTQPDFLDFAFNVDDYLDSTTNIETADLTGTNVVVVEVHNRGWVPVPAGGVRVMLLITDASLGLPVLPSGYAAALNAGNVSSLLAGTQWQFADATKSFGTNAGELNARAPQVVEFHVDMAALGYTTPGQHVCLAAFVTTAGDQLTSTNTTLDQLNMADRRVTHRNLHLVAAGARPDPIRPGNWLHLPYTFLVNLSNATERATHVELAVERARFPGHLSVMLPKLPELEAKGFEVARHDQLEGGLGLHVVEYVQRRGEELVALGQRLERAAAGGVKSPRLHALELGHARLERAARIDHSRVFVAQPGHAASIHNIPLAAHGQVTAAVTVQPPAGARIGDRFRFDLLQKQGSRVIGGSTYVVAVVKPSF